MTGGIVKRGVPTAMLGLTIGILSGANRGRFLGSDETMAHAVTGGMVAGAAEDAALVAAFQGGDAGAFDALVARHKDGAYGLALRLTGNAEDAAEVAQDAFVRAYRSLTSFRGEAAFGTWLYRVVVNLARNRVRDRGRRGRNKAVSMEALQEREPTREHAAAASTDPRAVAVGAELDALLAEALAALPETYREVFVLRVQEEMPYEAIAGVLEVPVGTVKSRLHAARRQLHGWLRERGAL